MDVQPLDITDFGTRMTFQLDEIKSVDYGEGKNLSCQLEYVLPPGAYQISPAVQDPIRFKKLVNEMVSLCRDLWPDLLDEEVVAKITDYAYCTALLNPSDKMELEHPRMRTMIMFYCFHYALDDAQDELSSTTGGSAVWSYKEFPCWYNMYRENIVKAYEQLPSIVPQMDLIKQFGILYAKQIVSSCPHYQEKFPGSALDKETFWVYTSNIIESDLKKEGKAWSISTNFDLDRYVSAVRALFEYMALFHDIEINEDIRKDLYFQVAINSYANILSYYNALLGFPRDIKLKQETGPLMHLIVDKKMLLGDAFQEMESQLKFAYNDYRISTEKLVEVYGQEIVGPAVRLMGYIIDGSLYAYKVFKRYGIEKNLKIIH